jgi:DNA/RNA-binding domain of Phe-tRNA-synthetase-like protein
MTSMLPFAFEMDASVAGRLELAAAVLRGVQVRGALDAFEERVTEALQRARDRFGDDDAARAAQRKPARDLYRAFGIDPTRRRPSSEAMLRRVLKGFQLPRVHPLVDAMNLCQLEQGLSYGLYDTHSLAPPVRAAVGEPGAGYPGIRKGFINVEGRPALLDTQGPFGNPSSDSLRAAVGPGTTSALVVIFAPAGTGCARLERALSDTLEVFGLVAAFDDAGRKLLGTTT